MPNVYGRIARNGPVADRSGSLKASMIRNATASAHMAADHSATMAPFHPSAVATAAASPSHFIGLKSPRSMPNAGTAAITATPRRAWLPIAELLVSGFDGRIGAWPNGRRRCRLGAGPDHPAVALPKHPLAVGKGHARGAGQGGVDLEINAGHHPVRLISSLDQTH